MSKITCDIAVSLDGFAAGPNQSLENPFGEGVGDRLHRWIESALAQARDAAAGADIAIAGGAETARQYLATGLVDELRLHVAPVILGRGERLLDGVGDLELEPLEVWGTGLVTHLRYRVGR